MTTLASITCSSDGEIRTFTLDGEQIMPLATSPIGGGVAALAPDATGTRGFCGTKEPRGIATVELDADSGRWTKLAHTPTDDAMTYLQLTADGRFLVGVSYGGGFGQVWPVADGILGEPTARVAFRNLHCAITVDEHVYLVSLGEDLVACYRLTGDGELVALAQPTVAMPAGSGPRHLVAAADGRNLYCMTEFSGEVVRLERDPSTGCLTRREAVDGHATDRGLVHGEIDVDPAGHHRIWGADLHLARGGRFVVASERCESTLAVIAVGEDGSLGERLCVVDTEQQPRGFAVVDDHLVLCPGEKSDQISLFELDAAGQLTRLAQAPSGMGGNWVRLLQY